MAYDACLEQRIRQFFIDHDVTHESKSMMGGLCFMVRGKMCVGVERDRLMVRIGPEAYDEALKREGCRPMDFTGRPMRGFVYVGREVVESTDGLAFWLDLALAFNPLAKSSTKKRTKSRLAHKTDAM